MLCEKCHQKEASCHIVVIESGAKKSIDLCIECHEKNSPDAIEFLKAQSRARCEYCGGQPCAGGTDFLALITGIQKLKFMCMPCSMEHNRYVQQQLQANTSGLSQHEQLALFRQMNEDRNHHMKVWVLKRDS